MALTKVNNTVLALSGTYAVSISGNAATATTAGTVTTAAQPTITSVGILTNLQTTSLGIGTAASGTAGEIRATNDITAYYSSDARLKENVANITNALSLVKQLNGVRFDWTDEFVRNHGGADGYFVRKNDIGLIAQEVQEVFPELVGKRQDGILALKYDRLVAVLIEAVKELSAEVEELKNGR